MTTKTALCALAISAAVVASGCGGSDDAETSVLLVITTAADAQRPEQVQIDVYKEDATTASVLRAVAGGADPRLGDIVIYPSAGVARVGFVVLGKRAGTVVSSAAQTVDVVPGKQVVVEVTLRAGLPDSDGGLVPDDGGSDGGLPTDVALGDAPIEVDAAPPKKAMGEACAQGGECTSGACLDGVCCNRACDGRCNSCKAAGEPLGQCTPVADGTKCGEPKCGAAGKTLTEQMCMAGSCQSKQSNCGSRMCDAATLMCQ